VKPSSSAAAANGDHVHDVVDHDRRRFLGTAAMTIVGTHRGPFGRPAARGGLASLATAFRNQYWPALYFIDARGRVRGQQFGEGEYERSEKTIQRLLVEAGVAGAGEGNIVSVAGKGVEAAADWGNLKSPEAYIGYDRLQNFASRGAPDPDRRRVYTAPTRMALNRWALAGEWTIGKQAAALTSPNGRIVHRFHARDVHLVMGPAQQQSAVRFRVSLDGQRPGGARGLDVDEGGNGTVAEQRLYQLVRQPGPIVDRTFEIEFLDAGVEAFAFTFG
jgi:hypothetical protein